VEKEKQSKRSRSGETSREFFETVPGSDPTMQNKENTDEVIPHDAQTREENRKMMTFGNSITRRLAANDLTLGSAETGVLSAVVLLGTFCIFKFLRRTKAQTELIPKYE